MGLKGVGSSLPEGTYTAKIVDVEINDMVDEGKSPYDTYKIEVTKATDKKLIGRTALKNFSRSDAALWAYRRFLKICGFSEKEMDAEDFAFDTDSLIGQEFIVEITDNGGNYPVIEFVSKIKQTKQDKIK